MRHCSQQIYRRSNMKKTILDDDCRKMLLDSLKELGFENADAIVSEKYKSAVKEQAIKIMERFLDHFKKGEYQKALDMIALSPAGDGWGSENYYLNMREIGFIDVESVISHLSNNKLKYNS